MTGDLRQLMTAAEIQRDFRRLTPEHDQRLRGKSADEVHGNGEWMAPGGPFLAQLMADRISPKDGERILDLGCGRGQSSVFLATRYGARVVSVDLWVSPEQRNARAAAAGVGSQVVSLQGDIGRGLPADFANFDAIFCLQAFHCFGTAQAVLRYLAALLKPGGRLCFSQGCFRREVDEMPALFRQTNGWKTDYRSYHSPVWWRDHIAASGLFDVLVAEELEAGQTLWEDDVLYRGDRAAWSDAFLSDSAWLIRQIAHGQNNSPTLTHCIVCAERKA
jgi:SAM-dependent methyltransferase